VDWVGRDKFVYIIVVKEALVEEVRVLEVFVEWASVIELFEGLFIPDG